MKKILGASLLITGATLSGCKKDRTCECITTPSVTSDRPITVMNPVQTSSTSTVYKKSRESDMKTLCANSSYITELTLTLTDGTTYVVTQKNEVECKLK